MSLGQDLWNSWTAEMHLHAVVTRPAMGKALGKVKSHVQEPLGWLECVACVHEARLINCRYVLVINSG